jgi:hypothetical protein
MCVKYARSHWPLIYPPDFRPMFKNPLTKLKLCGDINFNDLARPTRHA